MFLGVSSFFGASTIDEKIDAQEYTKNRENDAQGFPKVLPNRTNMLPGRDFGVFSKSDVLLK